MGHARCRFGCCCNHYRAHNTGWWKSGRDRYCHSENWIEPSHHSIHGAALSAFMAPICTGVFHCDDCHVCLRPWREWIKLGLHHSLRSHSPSACLGPHGNDWDSCHPLYPICILGRLEEVQRRNRRSARPSCVIVGYSFIGSSNAHEGWCSANRMQTRGRRCLSRCRCERCVFGRRVSRMVWTRFPHDSTFLNWDSYGVLYHSEEACLEQDAGGPSAYLWLSHLWVPLQCLLVRALEYCS